MTNETSSWLSGYCEAMEDINACAEQDKITDADWLAANAHHLIESATTTAVDNVEMFLRSMELTWRDDVSILGLIGITRQFKTLTEKLSSKSQPANDPSYRAATIKIFTDVTRNILKTLAEHKEEN